MDIRKYASRSSQIRDIQSHMQNFQTATAMISDNIILRNRYVRLRKTSQKLNHFTVNRVVFKPQSETALYEPPSKSEEFISNFIRCQKQKIANKLSQPMQTSQELLRYIQTKIRQGRSEQGSIVISKQNNSNQNTNELRQSRTQKHPILPAMQSSQRLVAMQSPQRLVVQKTEREEKILKKSQQNNSRQTSQSLSSSSKLEAQIDPVNFKSGQIQVKIRRNHNQKPNLKSIKQTIEEMEQVSETERKGKPLLLHDIKHLGHIKSESYAVFEYPSAQLILSYRSKQAMEIASLTKIMTCYMIIKMAEQQRRNIFDETFEVKQYVEYSTGTTAELIHGDCYTIEQLLYALMLPSGNDAALSLADWAGGLINPCRDHKQNIKVFVKEMNVRVKQLGLKDTRFGNPHGLPHKDTRSNAFDICSLCIVCLGIPLFRKIISTKFYRASIKTTQNLKREVVWQNTNKLLRRQGFLGVKTGITVTAGPCLASAYTFKDKTYVLVLLRANKVSRRFTETRKILYWVLKSLHLSTLTPEQTKILEDLRRNKRDLDSDNSEDEAEFTYSKEGMEEYAKRQKILKYQL